MVTSQFTRTRIGLLAAACLGAGFGTLPGTALAEEEDLDELLELVAEETELATRSRQNADYVPGIVTVLHGDEARLLGARTALEALAMVPGIDVSRDQFGSPTLRVRGVDFFFNGGNVKVLVDGLPISREAALQNGSILLMPIGQIDRIDLIRGPGSGVHGDFAYMGLVNLITRHRGNALGLGAGRGDRHSVVAHFAHSGNDASISGNLSRWTSDRYDTSDALDNDELRQMLNLKLALQDFSFTLVALDRDWQGMRLNQPRPGQPPPSTFSTNIQRERSYNTEFRYNWLNEGDNRGSLWLQRQHNEYERQNALFEGPRSELGGDWSYQLGRHRLLLQVQWARLEIDAASRLQGPGPAELLTTDSRDMHSQVLQDQITINDQLQVVAGVRHDDLEGIDSELTPRFAVVWRVADHHLLKAQYAEGFRSPTVNDQFVEGQSIGRQEFEKIQTREISYVYRRPHTVFRATGFSNRISDMLFPPTNQFFGQGLGIRAQGLEFELTHRPWRWLKIQATWSTANTRDDRAAVRPIPGQPPESFGGPSIAQAESLGNLALLFNQGESWSGGVQWQHVGRRADRGQAGFEDGYDILNLGLSYLPPWATQLRFDWGLRNALDDDVFYVETVPRSGLQPNRYADREWYFALTMSFD